MGYTNWQMIGVLAELDRSLISERTRAGVKAAKHRGVKFGRKRKLTAQDIAKAKRDIDAGERCEDVAAYLKVNCTTPLPGACRVTAKLLNIYLTRFRGFPP